MLPRVRGPVGVTGILHGFPLFECGFDCQKISMLAVIGMLLDGNAASRETATTWDRSEPRWR